jgi:lipopolysaccharide biosynthesis regulator YciM
LASYRAIGKLDEGMAQLRSYLQTYKLPSLQAVVYEAVLAEEGPESAAALAREELNKRPSLQTLDQLLKARMQFEKNDQHDTNLTQQTVRSAIGNRNAFVCDQCGFRAKNFHWQCPACNAWEAIAPEPNEPNT